MTNPVIIHWALVDQSSGEIVRMGGTHDHQMLLAMEEPGFDMFMNRPKEVFSQTHFYDYQAGEWATRWQLLDPDITYDMANLPEGSIYRVEDESGQVTEVTGQEDIVVLTDPGRYRVTIDAPFPWISIRRFEVTVEDLS